MIGSMVVGFALAWYLKEDTGSATILSTSMMMNFLPMVILEPFIGPFIDRWNRKMILIMSDLSIMLLTVLLVILFLTDTIQVWHVYGVMLGRAVGESIQRPTIRASIPMIVPEKHLVRANGLSATLDGILIIFSPVAGAFLFKYLPMEWVLSVDIITAIIAVGILLPLVIPQPVKETIPEKLNVFGEMNQGLHYIISRRSLLFLYLNAAILNFFMAPLFALLPLFVENYLGDNVLNYGWLVMTSGIGVLAGGLILSVWGGFRKRMITAFTGTIIQMVAIIVFGFTTETLFFLALAMWLLSHVGEVMANGPIGAIMQSIIPYDMQGKIFTVLDSIRIAPVIVSLGIVGPVAEVVELRWIYVFSGGAMLIAYLFVFYYGRLITIEDQKTTEKPVIDNSDT